MRDRERVELVFSLDWRPRIGGAHFWLEQVYRRWPGAVSVLCATPMAAGEPASAAAGGIDAGEGFDRIDRSAIPMPTIDADLPTLGRFLRNALRLRRLMGSGPARIHCKGAFPEGVSGLIAARLGGRRRTLVVYAHGEEMLVAESSRLLSWLLRLVFARADLIVANSESTRRLVHRACPVARVAVVHPGVDPIDPVAPSEIAHVRAQLRLPADRPLVIGIGRLEPRKNQVRVIEALARLRAEGIEASYVCVGDGEARPALEAAVARHAAGDWVRLVGAVDDAHKQALLAASDVFAMPSVRHGEMIEGFGLVFLEAAAAGLPSIAGEVGGQGEAVRHGETGLVVDGSRVESIAQALRELLLDPVRRAAMGRAGRVWADRHAWPDIVARTVAAIDAVGAGHADDSADAGDPGDAGPAARTAGRR